MSAVHAHAYQDGWQRRSLAGTCAAIVPLLRQGQTSDSIGRLLHIDGKTIAAYISNYELRTFREVETSFDPPRRWPYLGAADRKHWICEGLASGRSPAQVAVGLGTQPVTLRRWCLHNSVVLGDESTAPEYEVIPGVSAVSRTKRNETVHLQNDRKAARSYESSDAWDALDHSKPVPLMRTSERTCKWPCWRDGQDGPRHVCGAAIEPGKTYCSEHRQRSSRANQEAVY